MRPEPGFRFCCGTKIRINLHEMRSDLHEMRILILILQTVYYQSINYSAFTELYKIYYVFLVFLSRVRSDKIDSRLKRTSKLLEILIKLSLKKVLIKSFIILKIKNVEAQ